MQFLIVPLLLLLFILIGLVGMGLGVGLFLRWLSPPIDWGMAVLIGVFASSMTIHFFARLMAKIFDSLSETETVAKVLDESPLIESVVLLGQRKRRSSRQKP
jgi:NhaP-type Na+/H+ or K+/H+ antiporter